MRRSTELHDFEPESMVVYLGYSDSGRHVFWTWEAGLGNKTYMGSKHESKQDAWVDMMAWLDRAQALEVPRSRDDAFDGNQDRIQSEDRRDTRGHAGCSHSYVSF